jgi:hypothetical protein
MTQLVGYDDSQQVSEAVLVALGTMDANADVQILRDQLAN